MKALIIDLLWSQLAALGAFDRPRQGYASLRDHAGIQSMFDPWLRETLRVLANEGYLERRGDEIEVLSRPRRSAAELWDLWEQEGAQWLANPDLRAQRVLLDVCLRALPDVLTGRKLATEVVFPDSSVALVENTYKYNPMAAFYNRCLAQRVESFVRYKIARRSVPGIRIIEIGAGTGATSAVVFETLKNYREHIDDYRYTDISKAFLNHAEKTYGPDNPFLSYGVLNIELPPAAQGFEQASYDMVIAANCLHATRDIRTTLGHAKSLLKPNGMLLLNELTVNNLFNHLAFGLLTGWWAYDDHDVRLTGCPGLSPASWRHVLEGEGFRMVTFPRPEAADMGQQIIVAESDGIVRVQREMGDAGNAAAQTPAAQAPAVRSSASAGGAALPPACSPNSRVVQTLVQQLAGELRIDASRIARDEAFSSYGMDSIIAVNLTSTIGEALGIDLDITALFEHNTIDTLCAHILSTHPELREEVAVERTAPDALPVDSGVTMAETASRVAEAPVPEHSAEAAVDVEDIAVIGVDGTFPGAADLDAFWQVLKEGRRCITQPPQQRKEWRRHVDATWSDSFDMATVWAGFLDRIDTFDPLFFGLAPTEAEQMSPEQRLLLMCVWNMLENAAYTPKALAQQRTGVFVAAAPSEYHQLRHEMAGESQSGLMSAPSLSLLPNRISYLLNLRGPSEVCDTTCSSSLVAIHRAVQAIRLGECDQAIVGAVNLVLTPVAFKNMAAVGMLSPTGDVRPFQDGADGTARGEGVGAILIKPLRKAIEHGDMVHAVIKGTGVAHGGRGVSMTAPNILGMKDAMQQAYLRVDPRTIGYIEAHGMSTALADSAEISALKSGLEEASARWAGANTPREQLCHIGSLKPCIGHTEVCSGMAALIKVVLAMRHGLIPGIPGFGRPADAVKLDGTPLRMATANQNWEPFVDVTGRSLPRRAAVNGYGIGGVNAHVVLEEPLTPEAANSGQRHAQHVIVLSAKSLGALNARARALRGYLSQASGTELAAIAYTLQTGREAMEWRLACVVGSLDELSAALDAYLSGARHAHLYVSKGHATDSELIRLISGETGDMLVRSLIRDGKLSDVARYWTMGAAIDWSLFREGHNGGGLKIALPGYPFQRGEDVVEQSGTSNLGPIPNERAVEQVRGIVASILGLDPTNIDVATPLDRYGLNSLLLLGVLQRLRDLQVDFEVGWLRADGTIRDIAAHLHQSTDQDGDTATFPELLKLNAGARGKPVFWIHGALGSVETFSPIADKSERPFFGIQAKGFMTRHEPNVGIRDIAAYYLKIVRSRQAHGPYDLGGFCLGGIIAYEITRQLQLAGEKVDSLVMIDSPDNTGFAKASKSSNVTSRSAALQLVNTLLWPADKRDLQEIARTLIRHDELNACLDDDSLIEQMVALAVSRGLAMKQETVAAFVRKNIKVQTSYKLHEFVIESLPDPRGVDAYYFRNRGGLFYGELLSHFSMPGEKLAIDQVNYWQDWQRELPNLSLIDIDAHSHMTILSEERCTSEIVGTCARLYRIESDSADSSRSQCVEEAAEAP